MESEALWGPKDQGNGFVLTYCHLGKTLWEATALAEVLTEWPLGGEPRAAGLAAAWRGEGGRAGAPTPQGSPPPPPGSGRGSLCNPLPTGPKLQARLCLHLFELRMQPLL